MAVALLTPMIRWPGGEPVLAYFESTLSWTELLKRTYREMMDDNALGLAAQLAY